VLRRCGGRPQRPSSSASPATLIRARRDTCRDQRIKHQFTASTITGHSVRCSRSARCAHPPEHGNGARRAILRRPPPTHPINGLQDEALATTRIVAGEPSVRSSCSRSGRGMRSGIAGASALNTASTEPGIGLAQSPSRPETRHHDAAFRHDRFQRAERSLIAGSSGVVRPLYAI